MDCYHDVCATKKMVCRFTSTMRTNNLHTLLFLVEYDISKTNGYVFGGSATFGESQQFAKLWTRWVQRVRISYPPFGFE